MKSIRYLSMMLAVAGIASGAYAHGTRAKLLITPHEALVQPGQGVKFEAAAFGADGQPLRIESVRWSVAPDTLGRITEDGFFVAGRFPGRGKVLALAKIPQFDLVLEAQAVVVVGRTEPPRDIVVVSPPSALVPPGQTQQFEAAAFTPGRVPVRIKNVRWNVRPESLGKIDETGRFTAGREFGEGVIHAFAETELGVFNGEARVIVVARPSAAITGKVTTANGGPAQLAGVVFAESVGPNRWRGEARIDERGNYFIGQLVPGLYVVRAQARGFLPEFYQEAGDYLQATPVQLAAQETAEGIDFTLEPGGTIQGTVGGDDRDALLSGAHVVAILTVRPAVRHHAVTNAEGKYAIENLRSGTYAVFAEAEGYKGEYYDDAQSLLEAKLIQVAAPQTVDNIDLSLAPGSAIAGLVIDAITQAPLANARISIAPAPPATRPFVKIVTTNESGEYLAGVPAGNYLVSAQARGYLPEFYDGARHPREATIVEVKPDERTTGVDFALDQPGAITGVVVEQSDARPPLAGAVVLAFPERDREHPPLLTPNVPLVGSTDPSGAYKIAQVLPGKYYVLAEARGYLNEYWQESPDLRGATLVEVKESEVVSGIDFTLEKGGAISGEVVSANDGSPLAGASVQVWSRTSNAAGRGETDREGKYRIAGLRNGDYLVSVEARGFRLQFYDGADSRDHATPVKVEAPNETGGIDFNLLPVDSRRGAISGMIVSEADGNPIPNAVVLALPLQPGAPQFAFVDRLGGYKLAGLAQGRYVLFAYAPRFVGEFYDDARNFQAARPVGVEAGQETGGIDFKLAERQRGAYMITGTVRAGNGDRGEGNAVVYAVENDIFVASALTDDNGNFALEEMPSGSFKVMATAPGGLAFFGGRDANSATPVFLGNGANANNVNLTVPSVTAVEENGEALPSTFALDQNYPNPFNPQTEIPYQLATRSAVKLVIYNALGQEVRRLVSATQEAGVYLTQWDGKDDRGRTLTSGVYIYRLHAGETVFTRKMIYLR